MTRIGRFKVDIGVERMTPLKLVHLYVLEDGKWRRAIFERGKRHFSAPLPGTRHRDCRVEYRRVA